MYRGNGTGTWATGVGQQIGSGWGPFTALLAPGDFTGDGYPDVLGTRSPTAHCSCTAATATAAG